MTAQVRDCGRRQEAPGVRQTLLLPRSMRPVGAHDLHELLRTHRSPAYLTAGIEFAKDGA